jgi:hypothetical protein
MNEIMPRSKYDLNHITDTITENYIQLKENKRKVVYPLVIFKMPITSVRGTLALGAYFPFRFHLSDHIRTG